MPEQEPGRKSHDLGEEIDRLVEAEAAGVQAGVDAHAQVAVELALELVEPLLGRVEPVRRAGCGSAMRASA